MNFVSLRIDFPRAGHSDPPSCCNDEAAHHGQHAGFLLVLMHSTPSRTVGCIPTISSTLARVRSFSSNLVALNVFTRCYAQPTLKDRKSVVGRVAAGYHDYWYREETRGRREQTRPVEESKNCLTICLLKIRFRSSTSLLVQRSLIILATMTAPPVPC